MKIRVDELATRYVDHMAAVGPVCDFVQEVAVNFPLFVIMSLLGVPEEDFPRMLAYTQELFGNDDAEFSAGASKEDQLAVLLDMFGYFNALTAARREQPTEDLASAIANARIDGEPLSDVDTVSYYVIIATAGHDTTSATISGGLQALIEHPEQLRRLQADPSLMGLATEEMIRWVTPVKEFMRTAQQDNELRGVPIAAGDSVLLSYPSGNRDEDVFTDPFRFDVSRDPNKHVAFGYGVHFCLGAALARMEVNSFFSALLPRLKSIELSGTPEHTATIFVGGLKHLPIRYELVSADRAAGAAPGARIGVGGRVAGAASTRVRTSRPRPDVSALGARGNADSGCRPSMTPSTSRAGGGARCAVSASHCFCTSFSALVGIIPDGAKMRDGTGSSSDIGRLWPRITLSATITPATNTMTTNTAKMIDSVPWMKVLRITASSWSAFLAAPKVVLPASLALRYEKCWVQ